MIFNYKIKNKGFVYFYGDNVFSEEKFKNLNLTWPSNKQYFIKKSIYGGKKSFQRDDELMSDFLNNHLVWKETIKELNSQDFIDQIFSHFKPIMTKKRPLLFFQKWSLYNGKSSLINFIFKRQVEIDWEFSIHNTDSFLQPHTDKISKILSLIFYFPSEGWKPEYLGGTSIYSPKYKRHESNWFNYYVPQEYVNEIDYIDYKKNRVAGFFKTKNSYHGVRPCKHFYNVKRKAFIVNITYPKIYESFFIFRLINYYYRKIEWINYKEFSDFYKKMKGE